MTRAIAVLLPNWLGDAVMATPALRALRGWAGAETRIVAFGRWTVCELLAGNPRLDALQEMPAKGILPLQRAIHLALSLRAGRFDTAVLLSNGFGVAGAAWLAGIPQRAGYDRRGRGLLLSLALTPPHEGKRLTAIPAIDYYLGLVEALGGALATGDTSARMELATTGEDENSARRIWNVFGDRRDRPTVLLNNNAARSLAKLWPEAAMAELARRIAANFDLNVGILAGPGEEARASATAASATAAGAASARVALVAASGIGVLKACIRRSRLLVSTDSAPRAIAAAFAVPLISLFGATDPRWTSLRIASDTELRGDHQAMRHLSVDRVWAAVARQLASAAP